VRKVRKEESKENPLLVVISGPSGVGKDTVLAHLRKKRGSTRFMVTVTTRPRRAGERDGLDYHFVSLQEFERIQAEDGFLESAQVYGHRYGVPKGQLKKALARGEDVVVKVDVQGAATIKSIVPEAVFIFLAPPSMEELEGRLRQRKTEPDHDLKLRAETACQEMESLPMFDYVVTNHRDRLELTLSQIEAIITAEKCRVKPRSIEI